MKNRTKYALAGATVIALGAIGTGVGLAAGGGDDAPLTGSALDQATDAALAHVGGGTVIETEVGDDGAVYGVEVRRADGSVVEVNLDRDFQVIGADPDDDGAGDTAGDGD